MCFLISAHITGILHHFLTTSTPIIPCYAAWGAIAATPIAALNSSGNTVWIGTLNTKLFSGYEYTFGSTYWLSTEMLSDVDESGTCVSAWFQGEDIISSGGVYDDTYNIKLIAGGQHC